jgi:hypothetical protein
VKPLALTCCHPVRITFPGLFYTHDEPYNVETRSFAYNNRPVPFGEMKLRATSDLVLPSCTRHIPAILSFAVPTTVMALEYTYKDVPEGDVGTLVGTLMELRFRLHKRQHVATCPCPCPVFLEVFGDVNGECLERTLVLQVNPTSLCHFYCCCK